MAEKKDTRREYLKLEASNSDGTITEVQISYLRMHTVARRSMGQAKECGLIMPEIIQNPTAMFEGLRWDEDEDPDPHGAAGWRCYCGIPSQAFHADGTSRPAYPGQVYLVFVNDEKVAYNWRWEKADPENQGLPIGHQERFKKPLMLDGQVQE